MRSSIIIPLFVCTALSVVYNYNTLSIYSKHQLNHPPSKTVVNNDAAIDETNIQYENNKIYFVSFNSKHGSQALKRIQEEAITFYNFSKIHIFDADVLLLDKPFFDAHANFIQNNPRGYGYWIWKPFLIRKVMQQVSDNAFVLYVDSGCTLSVEGKQRFEEYMALMKYFQKDILCFQMQSHLEKQWSKRDTTLFLNATEHDLDSGQIMATAHLWRKTQFSLSFLNLWLDTATVNNYHYVDDTPSREPNDFSFTEHRHDQSIFSLLIKTVAKDKAYVINHDETWSDNWDSIKHIPIHAMRWNN